MSPLIHLRARTLLAAQSTPDSTPATMSQKTVFILCIVFGSLLACILVATLVYLARRQKCKRRDIAKMNMHREASFIAGAPSVLDMAPPQPTRRLSIRATGPLPKIAIPSPELGSVFRLDTVSSLVRGSSARSPMGRPPTGSRPRSGSVPLPKAYSSHRDSLFSRTSTVVASEPDKVDFQLRVMNPSNTHSTTTGPQIQKPVPVYRPDFTSSRERLVSSTASADSLFLGSTSTPPLSPLGTWSRPGTNRVHTPTELVSNAASVTIHKAPSQQSTLTQASSPHIAVECFDMSHHLVATEPNPRVRDPLASPPPLDRWDPASGTTGTPVTLSHFPFRFSAGAPSSPGLSPIASIPLIPSSHTGVLGSRASQPHLGVPLGQVQGLGLSRAGSKQSLPCQSTPALKLKIHHSASDEIIAIAFAPQTINFQAVSDAVHGRLGFAPRRVWSDEGVAIVDDSSLHTWLDSQYTKGHTRLMLHVE